MSELVGKELGLYQILEYISAGGMSTVYKAYHAALDRHVAIKVLPAQTGQAEELRQRFQQEVRVIARLQHAHILPIFDYGQDGGRLYLVMRLIEHGSLADRLRVGTMSVDQISRVVHQVGDALSYAHSQGIVHRDVKPSNVLIDGQDNCYLSDFGLAKTMQASVRFTATGVGLGTPAYMSPEQGKGEVVDERSDVYSLGVMLYEMVTGQVPYQADTPLAVMLKHITAPVPKPSRIRPDILPALEQVLLIALDKEPNNRFQSVAELVQAFDGAVIQGTMPIVVPGPLVQPTTELSPAPLQPVSPPVQPRQNGGQTQIVLSPALEPEPQAARGRLRAWPLWRLVGAAVLLVALVAVVTAIGLGAWSDQREALRATETALSVTQVALARDLTATAVERARPSATPTATATSTATQTPTATQTATATATAAATPTTAVTVTATEASSAVVAAPASATPTETATAVPTRRPTATPTERWLPAPALLAPVEGAVFVGWNAEVTLRWAEVPGMEFGEYYVVRIPFDNQGGVAEFWRQETSLRLPSNFSLSEVGFPDRHYDWTVQVMRCQANCYKVWDDQAIKTGVAAGDESVAGRFYWQPDIHGSVPGSTSPTPTPTRHVPGE